MRDRILMTWIKIERKGLKRMGYQCYAIGAVLYSFYRLRVFEPMLMRLSTYTNLVQTAIAGTLKIILK